MLENFKHDMTEIANSHQRAMRGMSPRAAADYVKNLIKQSSVVLGVFQDDAAPDGVGMERELDGLLGG